MRWPQRLLGLLLLLGLASTSGIPPQSRFFFVRAHGWCGVACGVWRVARCEPLNPLGPTKQPTQRAADGAQRRPR